VARYGSFKYDSGTKYGTAITTSNLLWTFIVDWDGDGYYSGVNEAAYMVDLKVERGRDSLLSGKGFDRYDPGEAVGVFGNDDGRYDPYNTSSPLYPNVSPGKSARVLVKDGNTGTNYGVMRGTIADIQPFCRGRRQFARIVVRDGLRWLADRVSSVGLQSSQRVDQNIQDVLTAADWPTTEWPISFSNSLDTLTYYWAFKKKALQAINALEDCDVGVFFHDRDGNAVFRGRDYTHTRTKTVTQSEILADIVVPQPWEIIRNSVDVGVYPKALDTAVDLATGLYRKPDSDVPYIAAGATFVFDALFKQIKTVSKTSAPTAALNSACGSGATFSFSVNAQADGLGADLSASCELTNGEVGDGVEISIANNSGTNGYLGFCRVNGDAVYALDTSIQKASDSTSIAAYGPRSLAIDSYWRETSGTAQAIAAWLLAAYKDPTLHPTIQFEARPDYQFYVDLYDRVVLSVARKGISSVNFRVGKISHEWLTENGQAVRTQVKLEPYVTVFS
jgi:hypothetical protein